MGSRSWQIGQTQQLLLRSLGGALWVIRSHDTWSYWHYPAFLVLCCLGLEVWTGLAHVLGTARRAWLIPARGKHLDSFETVDYLCIAHNKVFTSLFTYHLLQFTQRGPFEWALDKLSCTNFLGGVVALFLVYDFFYTLFHMFLHHRSVYKYVHKHHHRQKAPSRGNSDAVNVHPFEFVTGEYNHLAAAYLVSRIMPVHALAVWTFVLLGGFAASLNHTRFDLKLPIFPSLFQVKYHDIHHWYPDCNYGQYSVLWDKVFGSFKPYPDDGLDSRAGGISERQRRRPSPNNDGGREGLLPPHLTDGSSRMKVFSFLASANMGASEQEGARDRAREARGREKGGGRGWQRA